MTHKVVGDYLNQKNRTYLPPNSDQKSVDVLRERLRARKLQKEKLKNISTNSGVYTMSVSNSNQHKTTSENKEQPSSTLPKISPMKKTQQEGLKISLQNNVKFSGKGTYVTTMN